MDSTLCRSLCTSGTRTYEPSCHRKPSHQFAFRRADPPFQVYRRGHHRRDRRRPPAQFVFRAYRQAKEEGVQTASVRHGMDAGPHRRKQTRQRYPSPRRVMAQGRLRWRDADYRAFDCLLDRSQPREETVLLPERSPRNRHLHCRGGKEIRRCMDRKRVTPGKRHVEPRTAAYGVQDGNRLRQDRRDGHAHRLAHSQQARQPAGCPLFRHLSDRHARHHYP